MEPKESIDRTPDRNANKNSLTAKRLIYYLAITFTITYLLEFLVIWPLANDGSVQSLVLVQLLTASAMFIPALSVLLTRLLTKEGFKDSWIAPKTGKHSIPYFLFGWFGPAVLTALGAFIFFLIFPEKYDPSMRYLHNLLSAQGIDASDAIVSATAVSQIISGILLGPILNFIPCFGEEWGWRGYLLPKMQTKCPLLSMLLINGVIWGLWHMPLTILGHNYGTGYPGYPVAGILAMCVFCIVMGAIFSYLTLRTGSCLPAVLAHGSLNGFASAGILFCDPAAADPFIGPAPSGIIGGIAFLICAAVMTILLLRKKSSRE